ATPVAINRGNERGYPFPRRRPSAGCYANAGRWAARQLEGDPMPYAKRDGLSLYYEQEGSGDPPLVFIHGWCCDHTFFQPQSDHFKASHAVTTLDLRGCGSSDQ